MMSLLLLIILVILVFLLGWLWVMSPGKALPFTDENRQILPGSISEKIFIDINGLKQGMFIKSKDAGNPVLLYLHGGMPEYFFTQRYPTGLENEFTVVWWEQRGSGLSYHSNMDMESITTEQLISDTKAVTHYLIKRFGKDKIYLLGHSGGTFTGIQVAEQAPELYHAYLGMAQMSQQLKSELLAYEYMLNQYKSMGNQKMIRKLEAVPVSLAVGTPDHYLALRDGAMHSLGIGTTRKMKSVITGIFLPSLMFREYTLSEKINLWRAKSRTGVSTLWKTNLATDLTSKVTQVDIPVYFFHGIYDYTVSYPLAREFFEKIEAPRKGFYTFDLSAHSPMLEEPEKMLDVLKSDVLNGTILLADTTSGAQK
ncbi:MAG: alpha/beta hydrolase [Saprospiraceae bacterium]|nr:alpha/beta hydrolase [Saprospiraceae bacterium]